jgi:hypothetical protein
VRSFIRRSGCFLAVAFAARSAVLEQLVDREPDISCNLPEQERRDVASRMEGNRSAPAVRVAKLFVRTPLSNFNKAEIMEDCDDLARLENGRFRHAFPTSTDWVPTNSASICGSPSKSNISITSRRLAFSSSREDACEWAPGNPGTYPT